VPQTGVCWFPVLRAAGIPATGCIPVCFQCGEFPRERTVFDPDLKDRWIAMNTRMREIGPEAYLLETKDLCRYR